MTRQTLQINLPAARSSVRSGSSSAATGAQGGLRIAIGSSAKKDELEKYLEIADIAGLVDAATSSEDAEESKPAPDIFQVALKKLGIEGGDAVAIGDTPYDATAARKAGIETIGVLCGGFSEASLRDSGCADVCPGPAALFACFERSLLVRTRK